MLRLSLLSAACQYGRSFQLWKLGGEQSPDASLNELLAREPDEVATDLDRRFEEETLVTGRVIRFPAPAPDVGGRARGRRAGPRHAVRAALRGRARPSHLEDPETLLVALHAPASEARVRAGSACATRPSFSTASSRGRGGEIGLFDERDYFLGETALLAGTACRQLSRREEAVRLVRPRRGRLPPHDQRGRRPLAPRPTSGSRSGSRSGSSTSCSRCSRRCSRASGSSRCTTTPSSAGSSKGWR